MRLQEDDKIDDESYYGLSDDDDALPYYDLDDDDDYDFFADTDDVDIYSKDSLDGGSDVTEKVNGMDVELDSQMADYLEKREQKQNKLKVDISIGKAMAAVILFAIMFVTPVAIYENYDSISRIGQNPVYSQDNSAGDNAGTTNGSPSANTGQNSGRVAGASDANDEGSVLGISTSNTDLQILGIPIASILIIAGIVFLLLPLLYLVQ